MASPSHHPSSILSLSLYLCLFISSIQFSHEYPQDQESDRILNLPGQPSYPSVSHFSGYITVNHDHGRALFYWFFEAQTNPSKKPLLSWLNGGPGCSSIGYGAAVELGPLRPKPPGAGLEFNKYAWNKEANLLFLESPVGVGFSYSNTSSDLTELDDSLVAADAYNFFVYWLKKFPQYQSHDFYISGESYAGHYVPQLAELVYERNKNSKNVINLKGFIVGNPETDDFYDSKGILEYAWSHAVIADQVYQQANQVCDFKLFNWTLECEMAMNVVFREYQEIDIYNIYAPTCLLKKGVFPSQSQTSELNPKAGSTSLRRMRIPGGYDPCFDVYAEEYFNRADVQKALHANVSGHIGGKWKVCNNSILNTYDFTVVSILPIYTKLIKAGLRIWVYRGFTCGWLMEQSPMQHHVQIWLCKTGRGDADGRVPFIGSRYCVEALGLPLTTPWRTWYNDHQVAGRFVKYEGLTFATIRGAGHLVPLNKPREAMVLINSFLSGQDLSMSK